MSPTRCGSSDAPAHVRQWLWPVVHVGRAVPDGRRHVERGDACGDSSELLILRGYLRDSTPIDRLVVRSGDGNRHQRGPGMFAVVMRASRVVAESAAAPHGEKSAVLRREGLYQSQIQEWTDARDAIARGLPPRPSSHHRSGKSAGS
jgi:hypothetical protein